MVRRRAEPAARAAGAVKRLGKRLFWDWCMPAGEGTCTEATTRYHSGRTEVCGKPQEGNPVTWPSPSGRAARDSRMSRKLDVIC